MATKLITPAEFKNATLNDILDEEPVDLTTFIQDKKFLNNNYLSPIQYDAVRHLEQIFYMDLYPLLEEEFGEYWHPVRMVNEAPIMMGKGSGKDLISRVACSRIAYLLLCLKSPQVYYGINETDSIHTLNIAQTADQAKRAFFEPMAQSIKKSSWFRPRLVMDITPRSKAITFTKQIELISGNSEAENFEGLNPIITICDEISGFPSADQARVRGGSEARTAEGIYDVVRTSAASRFPETFKSVAISYPRYVNDPISKMVTRAREDYEDVGEENSIYYTLGPLTTWDVNPRYSHYPRVKVVGTDVPIPNIPYFINAYKRDPTGSRAKFECKPARSPNTYFRNTVAIKESFPKQPDEWIPPVDIIYYWGADQEGSLGEESAEFGVVEGWNASHIISPDLKPMDGAIYALHADLAITGDRAGIAMCHVRNWEKREHVIAPSPTFGDTSIVQNDDRPIVKVDFITCYEADMEAIEPTSGELRAREIQPRWFRNLIRELKKRGFVIGLVTFDQFQSVDGIQILESWGIPAKRVSVDRNKQPYANLRDVIYDGRLEGYYHELLLQEIEGLTDTGPKVDHMPGASKDLSDALCGAVLGSLEMGGTEGPLPLEINPAENPYESSSMVGGREDFWADTQVSWPEEARNFNSWR